MQLAQILPFWNELTPAQRTALQDAAQTQHCAAQTRLNAKESCMGLVGISTGRVRVFTTSRQGREMTLFRLLSYDLCLFSAACLFRSASFEIMLEAQEDTEFVLIPAAVYDRVRRENIAASNYTSELLAQRVSDLLMIMEQWMNQSLAQRIGLFLLEEAQLCDSEELALTHEEIARHVCTAREVVSRQMKLLAAQGLLHVGRGKITLTDSAAMRRFCEEEEG